MTNDKDIKIEYEIDYSSNELGNKPSKKKRFIIELLICLIIASLVSLFIITFIVQRTIVDGSSMYPTLSNGDNIIVDKLSYRFSDPKRFDIIVFPFYEETTKTSKNYIKRIIGLPGETIQIKDGLIYINDKVLEEDFGFEVMLNGGYASEPVKIKENEYFVIGDNRNLSKDSRHLNENNKSDVGCIKRENIIGKAWFRFYPIGKSELIK